MDLYLFTIDERWGADVVAAGATGVVVDWERRGKARRQAGEGTQINADTPADLARMRAATDGRLLCRINGWGPWTPAEVDEAVARGADEILLPMVRTPREVDRTLDAVAGRCGLGSLVETQDAVHRVHELARRPLSRLYLGLNDLRIDRRSDNLFTPLVDGTVDAVRAAVPGRFGVAGLTLPGGGFPVPSSLLAAELVRLGADFTFLRRAFTADVAGRDPAVEVPLLLDSLDELVARPLSRVYLGLNDLRIDRGSDALFAPLVDGTADRVAAACAGAGAAPFGVAGLTRPDAG